MAQFINEALAANEALKKENEALKDRVDMLKKTMAQMSDAIQKLGQETIDLNQQVEGEHADAERLKRQVINLSSLAANLCNSLAWQKLMLSDEARADLALLRGGLWAVERPLNAVAVNRGVPQDSD